MDPSLQIKLNGNSNTHNNQISLLRNVSDNNGICVYGTVLKMK